MDAAPADATPEDTGAPEEDAGEPDAGMDGGMDASPDSAMDSGLGVPCDGPPGLYIDSECTVLASDVEPYEPRFWLWSDGTDKYRFISLPEGRQIDTRDPDQWVYPVGTRIWKTFGFGEMKVETRLLEKRASGTGLGVWSLRTFLWNEAQNAVTEVTLGVEDALGTTHDIPPLEACNTCHGGGGSVDIVLGFGAIQSNHDRPGVTLQDLNDEGRLSQPVAAIDSMVPGNTAIGEGLGYLHANCGHCHGGPSPRAGMNLRLRHGSPTLEETNAWLTAVNQTSFWTDGTHNVRIVPRAPEESTVFIRSGIRDTPIIDQMPPLATEIIDPDGRDVLSAFINALPVGG